MNPFIRALTLLMITVVAPSLASASLSPNKPHDKSHGKFLTHSPEMRWIQVKASNKYERSRLANLGMSIEATRTDSVWGFMPASLIPALKAEKLIVLGVFPAETGRGGHDSLFDFPTSDAKFHNYAELTSELKILVSKHADISRLHSIGRSLEGRDIWAVNINTKPEDLLKGTSSRPGAIYMGNHHAREHVSLEIPLMYLQYLLNHRDDATIFALLDSRDIWVIPMVNPDGVEWDISTSNYKMWRKNRRTNADGSYGVDLNRNYGFMWGTGGSSTNGSSDVFMGPTPFSEPETQTIRNFVEAHLNAKVLLSFHTFSELILYPWGHKYDSIEDKKDLAVFEKLATTMAGWNKYKPQQASDLYIASGDTTDWAYGTHRIFAFTFELSPQNQFQGGFYPGASVIDRVFQENLKPCLHLLEVADNPYKVVDNAPSFGLPNYVEPKQMDVMR